MATTSSMFMYSLTLRQPSAISQAVLGQFAGTKEQQIVTASGSRLTLLRVDGNVQPLLTHDVFGIIRGLAAFRFAGSTKDFLIISSDSGRITIVEYIPADNKWQRVHAETFGKSGVRRVIPGQYLAADPKGRACMIASVEKNKLVYVLNRNAQAQLTISSPLEAHKPQTLLMALIALDVGYENPIFAALELEYGESDQDPTGKAYEDVEKLLVFYELDLGLNHVVRKWTDTVDRSAHMLFQVPGGGDGPSGVLVCGEENITYRHPDQEAFRVIIPRRKGATEDPQRKRSIVAGVMHKMRGTFFFLLQTEDGDLFKVTIDMFEDENEQSTGEVSRMKIKYFDTVPVASSLCILKSGYLFVAAETGNHELYQFEKLGDDDNEIEFTSEDYPTDPKEHYEPAYFKPRPLYNLASYEVVSSLNPLMSLKSINLDDDSSPQLYSVSGTGARSTFRTLRHGLEISEIVESPLPSDPISVWTCKKTADDPYDVYIILSFTNATLVLSIGETVEEVSDTGILSTTSTLAIQQIGEDSMIQVYPRGIRHIQSGGQINEWPSPQHRTIVAASTNERQVAVALSSGELVYFELDSDGSLNEYDERRELTGSVTCLSLGQVPEGRVRSSFLAVGCDDSTVRVLSLDPDSTLETKSTQALSAHPTALRIMSMIDSSGGASSYLHIGLYSGVYIRTVIDEVTGDLSDTRTRFLGPRPLKLFQVNVKEQTAILALSTKPWLGYAEQQTKTFVLTPLKYQALEYAWNFSSEQCPEGVVGIEGNHLRIFTIEQLSTNLLEESILLAHTPRGFARHPEERLFYVIESDANTLAPNTRESLKNDQGLTNGESEDLPPEEFGYPKGKGHWSSCIQVIDPVLEKRVLETIHLEDNESAVSLAVVPFNSQDDEPFLLIGTGKDMIVNPSSHSGGFIHVYRFQEDGKSLEFIHKTKLESPPRALLAFQGRLAAGIGRDLRIYDLGMRQLLRKAQAANATPNMIVDLQTQGSRIVAADIQESVSYLTYKHAESALIPFVDDAIARWTTSITMVDYETTAGGDKFGNLWLVRCPPKVSEEADEEGSGAHLINERQYLGGTPYRLEGMVHFFTQDIPISIQKTSLVPGGKDVLLWAGLQGTIGILVPFESREDVDFFQNLESQLRSEEPPLAGRDHLMYRGYYVPVKGAIDGDFCERYLRLDPSLRERIGAEVERATREVERKISDMRTRVAF